MKIGATNTYINAGLAGLLEAHGPQGDDLGRPLSAKLNWIMLAWDQSMRDEVERWRKKLADYEMAWLRRECGEKMLAVDKGLPAEAAVNVIKDTLLRAVEAGDLVAPAILLHVQKATVAARVALVWTLHIGHRWPSSIS